MNEGGFSELLERAGEWQLDFWGWAKWGVVAGLFVYLWFALMVVRQVDLMSRALNSAFAKPLKTVAWGYLIATGAVFLLCLIFL